MYKYATLPYVAFINKKSITFPIKRISKKLFEDKTMKRKMLEEAIAEAKTIKETAIASAKAALEEAFQPQLTAMFAEKLNELEEGDDDVSLEGIDETDGLDELNLDEILAELESDNLNEESSNDMNENLMLEEMSDEEIEELVIKVIDDMIASGKLVAGEENEEGDEDLEDVDVDIDVDADEDKVDTVDEELDIDALLAEMSGEIEEDADIDSELEEILAEMDKLEDLEEAKKSKKEEDEKDEELKEAYEAINVLKAELNEVNLLNAKLLYTNKIFRAKNLTESEKIKVLNTFDKAENVKEVKLVFETLNESFKANAKKSPIKESLGSASKTIATATPKQPIIEVNDAFKRMQQLAGLTK
jgi:hypothetical protein